MQQKSRTRHNFFVICLAVLGWLAVWSLTLGLFMSNFWLFDNLGIASDHYLIAAGIFTAIAIVLGCLAALRWRLRRQIFPKNKWLIAYIAVPIMSVIYVLNHGLSTQTFVLMTVLIISVFWQDFLTFGILQKVVTAHTTKLSWLIVASVFWLGHGIFYFSTLSQNVISWFVLFAGALLFALLTNKTKSFYMTDVLHMAFILLI